MPLIEYTMFGVVDKVEIALQRIRAFEPTDGYYLAFSGGKDSITIYRLAEMAGVQFDAHYNVTTVDPPELVKFIKEFYPTVSRNRPERSMFQYVLDEGWPPMRQKRWCCRLLKERGGEGRVSLTGIRWEESPRRAKRKMVESCYQHGGSYVHPIIDWSESDVWKFIREQELSYCSLYDEGWHRLGCVFCPMTRTADKESVRWPKFKKAWVNTFDKLIQKRRTEGKKITFDSGEELFRWWIRRDAPKKQSEAQLTLFD